MQMSRVIKELAKLSKELKSRLRTLIKTSELSQSEIARRIGVTRGSVGHWLKGGDISRDNLLKLCRALKVDMNEVTGSDSYLDLEPLKVRVIQLN